MKRLALLALFVFPAEVWANPAVVTTGEHLDFTRIVVTLAAPTDWRLGRVADGYTLSVDQQDLEYDLSEAFKRIPKTRIADVAQVPATSDLHIVAACACHVTAFAFRPNVIVVDIKAGEPPTGSRFEAPLVSFAPSTAPQKMSASTNEPNDRSIALDWADRMAAPIEAEKPTQILTPRIPHEFRETIVAQLGIAASQGLVTLDATQPNLNEALVRQTTPPAQTPEVSFRVVPEAGMEMRLGGGLDDAPALQEECMPAASIDLPAWGKDSDNPAEALSEIHRMLVTDADRLPDAQLADAARQYLYLGFGAEARLVLSAIPAPTPEQQALADIGLIIDGARREDSPFSGMETCNNAAALWAVLARDHIRPSEPIAAGAVVQAFAALPYHLRETLAGRLIDRLLERGDETSAYMIRDTISRVKEQTPLAMQLTEARLDLRENRREQARAALQAVSDHPGPDEAAALVALIDMAFAARHPVSADRIAMLETLAAQNHGQAIETDLRRSLVRAYALSGEFGLAHQALQQVPTFAGDFWTLIAERGSDQDILELAFAPPADQSVIDTESRFALAKKLHLLGFPQQALQWLNVPRNDIATLPDAMRMVIADSQLTLFQPRDALATISGLDSKADHIRTQAMLALGRSDEAATILQSNPDALDALTSLQRTERQWAALAAQSDSVWSGVAALAIEKNEPRSPEEPITLAGVGAIASKAGESRKQLSILLQETRLNPPQK